MKFRKSSTFPPFVAVAAEKISWGLDGGGVLALREDWSLGCRRVNLKTEKRKLWGGE